MAGLWRLYRHYFTWQGATRWTTGFGIVSMIAAASIPLLPVVFVGLALREDPLLWSGLMDIAVLALLAALGWAWLFASTRSDSLPRGIAAPQRSIYCST